MRTVIQMDRNGRSVPLLEDLLADASSKGGHVQILGPRGYQEASWYDIHSASQRAALWFESRLSPGSVVVFVGPISIDLVIAIQACWLAGMAICIAPSPTTPKRQHAVSARLKGVLERVRPRLVLSESSLLPMVENLTNCEALSFDEWKTTLSASHPPAGSARKIESNLPALVQLTSGTTGDPKVLSVPRFALVVNQMAIAKGMAIAAGQDKVVSWLPISHDMGLIGMLGVPMSFGVDLVLIDTALFAKDPSIWMKVCSEEAATITGGPSFAYAVAAACFEGRDPLDLSHLRVLLNGSEQIDVDAFIKFLDRGADYGLDSDAAFAVYGLAEATLAVSFPVPSGGLQWESVDADQLERGEAVLPTQFTRRVRKLALLGRAVEGVDVRLDSGGTNQLADGKVGEILIRGDSVVSPEGTMHSLQSGNWFRTGDLGYMRDGSVVVCGRVKDVIIVRGRNLFPDDIERTVGLLSGVFRGHCVAVPSKGFGSEKVSLIAEAEEGIDEAELRTRIRQAIFEEWEVAVGSVVLVSRNAIPRTTSGKLARREASAKFLERPIEGNRCAGD